MYRIAPVLYFAYGSNMSRARLESRVGPVEVIGPGQLCGYRHAFSKLGRDGTGKGNVHLHPGDTVYGALYRINARRVVDLDRIEGGYRRTEVDVEVYSERIAAFTYVALRTEHGLVPGDDYLAHYRDGIREHGITLAYWSRILRAARCP